MCGKAKARAVLNTNRGEQIAIRSLSDGDLSVLQSFNDKLSEQSRAWFLPHKYDEETISRYIERAKNSVDLIYVALAGGEIIGYFFLWNIRERFPVLGIGIIDAYQGQGLGRQMMEMLIDDARTAGCEGIRLTTVIDNERAYQLYRKMGFQYLGDTDNVAGDGRVVRERMMFLPLVPGARLGGHDFRPPV